MNNFLSSRHPELVSGPIVVQVRWPGAKANCAVSSHLAPSEPWAEWVLKRVQDDELVVMGARA